MFFLLVIPLRTHQKIFNGVPNQGDGVPNDFQKLFGGVPSMFYEDGIGYYF